MKTMVEIEVSGFTVPDSVIIVDGHGVEGETVDIKLLDPGTLDRLCNDFRAAVFKTAGKNEPPQPAPQCRKCGGLV